MDEDLFQMTRDDLIEEVRRLPAGHPSASLQQPKRTLLAPSFPLGVIAGKVRSDPCSVGVAAIHAGLHPISPRNAAAQGGAGINAGMVVADVGAGKGQLTRALAGTVGPGGHVFSRPRLIQIA